MRYPYDPVNLARWTLTLPDQAPREVAVPHAFDRETSVRFEGPVVYSTAVKVPEGAWLVFEGVSYQAQVSVNGEIVCRHEGIWDAFSVPLDRWAGQSVEVSVRVIKNGGTTFPVKSVLSGFLPYVFHTFGGLFRCVRLVVSDSDPVTPKPAAAPRIAVDGSRLLLDGKPWMMRGVLTWGWYPEIGRPDPDETTILQEIETIRSLGFNLVKFCLWMPSHRHLELLAAAGLEAWIELPLWAPSPEPAHQAAMSEELRRIVLQYRHHPNIVCWTVGCELSHETPAAVRRQLTAMVRDITGCPLVKDNSGGAEMYGGDLREYGTFYDFHPYCDTPFYPVVLDSLEPGSRRPMPILLGEFNDVDVHRDLPRLAEDQPYWSSTDPDLNDQGVRWQHDLPGFLPATRFARPGKHHERLMESTRTKALFIRKFVHEAVRSRKDYAGYVITGWRDTPISTAGVVDDHLHPRFTPDEMRSWNTGDCLFVIPTRRPPWVRGGNRPGYLDPYAFEEGPVFWKIGASLDRTKTSTLEWRIRGASGTVASGVWTEVRADALVPTEVGEVWANLTPGEYHLEVVFGGATNAWPFGVEPTLSGESWKAWQKVDPLRRFEDLPMHGDGPLLASWWKEDFDPDLPTVVCLSEGETEPCPFWREAGYEFCGNLWERLPWIDLWHRWMAVSGDSAISEELLRRLGEKYEVERVLVRVDVRTYRETCLLARVHTPGGMWLTTLRPDGGLGVQPVGVSRNPSGQALLRALAH